jgi:hypothetical protein
MVLNDSIVLDQGQFCRHRRFVPFNSCGKLLQFADLTHPDTVEPLIKLRRS